MATDQMTGNKIDTSDAACALICTLVSNPQGSLRRDGDGWQKRVNDIIRALRDERNSYRKLLETCRTRIKSQTGIGIVSVDPENEDPQHDLTELLPDLDDALGVQDGIEIIDRKSTQVGPVTVTTTFGRIKPATTATNKF